jgi:hypothetical protein
MALLAFDLATHFRVSQRRTKKPLKKLRFFESVMTTALVEAGAREAVVSSRT